MANSSEWTSGSLEDRVVDLIQKYAPRGILIDTNLLVVVLGTRFDAKYPGTRRAQKYTNADVDLVVNLVVRFGKIIATPQVMAETSNLLKGEFVGKKRDEMMSALHRFFCIDDAGFDEYLPDRKGVDPLVFQRLGFTDATIAVATGRLPLITADLDLHVAVETSGGDSINFWHLKEAVEAL